MEFSKTVIQVQFNKCLTEDSPKIDLQSKKPVNLEVFNDDKFARILNIISKFVTIPQESYNIDIQSPIIKIKLDPHNITSVIEKLVKDKKLTIANLTEFQTALDLNKLKPRMSTLPPITSQRSSGYGSVFAPYNATYQPKDSKQKKMQEKLTENVNKSKQYGQGITSQIPHP